MGEERPTYFHCALCGFEFEKHQSTCAAGCALARYCKLLRCPNCSYEFPEPLRSRTWFQKLFVRHRAPVPGRELMSLEEAMEGEQCELVCLNGSPASRRSALAVYGLVPGSRLWLTQKRPTFIIRVGETELAFESNIAREMFVRRVAPSAIADERNETRVIRSSR